MVRPEAAGEDLPVPSADTLEGFYRSRMAGEKREEGRAGGGGGGEAWQGGKVKHQRTVLKQKEGVGLYLVLIL